MTAVVRKIVRVVEETRREMGTTVDPRTRRAAAIAVIENPFAGRYVEDLSPLIAIGEELGELLSKKAVAALGMEGAKAQSYGKAAAVGENGELEHAAAILHPKMGAPVRKVLGKGAALIPSSKKRSGPGATLDIPLGHQDAAFVRSHFDGMEVQINDAPRANEIMVAVAVTDSGRPPPRAGALMAAERRGAPGLEQFARHSGCGRGGRERWGGGGGAGCGRVSSGRTSASPSGILPIGRRCFFWQRNR